MSDPQTRKLSHYFTHSKRKGRPGLPLASVTMHNGLVPRADLERDKERKTKTSLAADDHSLVEPGDIAYNMMRMWQGAFGLASEPVNVSPAYVVVRAKPTLDPRFAAHWLKSERALYLLWAYSYGLTDDRLRLYPKEFLQIPVAWPALSEQKRIASLLDECDNAIATAEKLVATKEQKQAALRKRLLTGSLRIPGFTDEWQWVVFSDALERVRRKNEIKNNNVLTISAQQGLVSQFEYFNKSVSGEDLTGYTLIHRGEFAYNKSYSDGYPFGAIKPLEKYESGVVSSLYICFKIKNNSCNEKFLKHYFDAGIFNDEIAGIAQEGARNHGLLNVSVVEFFETGLFLPDRPEQDAIAEILEESAREIDLERQRLRLLRNQKRGLMQALFADEPRNPDVIHAPRPENGEVAA